MGRQRQPQIRQRLLDACTDHALEHGLPDRLGPLAAAAGTSNRMLIYHFGTRDELLSEVLRQARWRQVEAFTDLIRLRPTEPYPTTLARAWSAISGPQGEPYLRMFGRLHDSAGEPLWPGFRRTATTDWLAPLEEGMRSLGRPGLPRLPRHHRERVTRRGLSLIGALTLEGHRGSLVGRAQPRSGAAIRGAVLGLSETNSSETSAPAAHIPPMTIIAGWYPVLSASARLAPAVIPISTGTRATAITPPTREAASLMAEASPRSASPTASSTAAVSGVTARPSPTPRTRAAGRTVDRYPDPGSRTASHTCEIPTSRIPATIGQRGPARETSRPLSGASTRKTSVVGISAAPAWVAE